MSVVIFAGPTLTAADGCGELPAIYLPPVSQGDVYRAARRRPLAIGIVDGYFDRVPAVWHKEILWAMSQGIHVYGGASMGALRAAELSLFGMVGVGWIFEAFRDGILQDDDEVAVAHGAEVAGYRPQSEAMVDIRRTLAAAVSAAIIDRRAHDTLVAIGKSIYYPERTYEEILRRAADGGLEPQDTTALGEWLRHGRINQKRIDAVAMLRRMSRDLAADASPKRVTFTFEHTVWWDRATSYAGTAGTAIDGRSDVMLPLDVVLDEVRLLPGSYRRAHDDAALEVLLLREAERNGIAPTGQGVDETADHFRTACGLTLPGDLERWLEENDLTLERFTALMREQASIDRARVAIDGDVLRRLPDHLRAAGSYARLAARARIKERTLQAHGLENPGLHDAGVTEDDLLRWYYGRGGGVVPVDLTHAAYEAGFDNADAFRIALLRELCFVRATDADVAAQRGGKAPGTGDS